MNVEVLEHNCAVRIQDVLESVGWIGRPTAIRYLDVRYHNTISRAVHIHPRIIATTAWIKIAPEDRHHTIRMASGHRNGLGVSGFKMLVSEGAVAIRPDVELAVLVAEVGEVEWKVVDKETIV